MADNRLRTFLNIETIAGYFSIKTIVFEQNHSEANVHQRAGYVLNRNRYVFNWHISCTPHSATLILIQTVRSTMVRQVKVNIEHKEKIVLLIHRLRTGHATDRDKQILEEYWENARRDNVIVDEMSAASCEKLKKEMFHAIQVRLGLK